MPSFREYPRLSFLPLAALALGAYYLLVLVPLGHRAQERDAPLQKARLKLAASLDQNPAKAIDFLHITNQLAETKQARDILGDAKLKAAARLELGAALRARMNATFRLSDYEVERTKQTNELTRLAKQQQTSIEPAVFAGFPELTADMQQPRLLWPALSFADALLRVALQCKVSAIHSLQVPLELTNAPPPSGTGAPERLVEIPMQIEFTGPAASAACLLQSLPLRADELRASGWPEAPADKPPLFVDRLILKKQSPDKLDEVRASVRAVGFVLRE